MDRDDRSLSEQLHASTIGGLSEPSVDLTVSELRGDGMERVMRKVAALQQDRQKRLDKAALDGAAGVAELVEIAREEAEQDAAVLDALGELRSAVEAVATQARDDGAGTRRLAVAALVVGGLTLLAAVGAIVATLATSGH